ncbi:hypothetical protein [Streptomyces scabiei]|uniref:hypothetical protein n=1 Tax=Streptomyces scabiei TaxID=1930 RepID=UPI000A813A52|nr:hypothetical protein [Streptomyces scabiei]
MTGREFTQQHGDPATWTTADIEAQQNLAAIDALPRTATVLVLPVRQTTPDHTPAA